MSQANISFVQDLYAAFQRGDIATIINALTPDAHWEINGSRQDYPLFGVRQGPAGVQEFFQSLAEHQDVLEFSPQQFYAAEDKVFVLGRYAWTLRKNRKRVGSDWMHVFTIRDGRVARFHEFTDTAQFAAAYRA